MKGGIEVLSRSWPRNLGPRKIAVNVIAPGAIETDFGGGAVRDNKEINRMIASSTALGGWDCRTMSEAPWPRCFPMTTNG